MKIACLSRRRVRNFQECILQTGYILAYHVSEARDVQAGMLIFPVMHHTSCIIHFHTAPPAERIYKFLLPPHIIP